MFELPNKLSVCPSVCLIHLTAHRGLQSSTRCPGMKQSPSLVVTCRRILTFGSFELCKDFQSSWHRGKVQHDRGIGSHILFKGAPIWPTAPLSWEAAALARLLHQRLSSAAVFLIQSNQDSFFPPLSLKKKKKCYYHHFYSL